MTAKDYWKKQEIKKGVNEELVKNKANDMKPIFDLMDKYASFKEKEKSLTTNKQILIT